MIVVIVFSLLAHLRRKRKRNSFQTDKVNNLIIFASKNYITLLPCSRTPPRRKQACSYHTQHRHNWDCHPHSCVPCSFISNTLQAKPRCWGIGIITAGEKRSGKYQLVGRTKSETSLPRLSGINMKRKFSLSSLRLVSRGHTSSHFQSRDHHRKHGKLIREA